jgi:AcrR family transcriptional regulator
MVRKKNYVVRTKRAIALRKKLFETAASLFEKEGYENVSVDEICSRVGVTKGAFYGHFKSKDQIILEKMAESDKGYDTEILSKVSHMKPGLDKLLEYIRAVMAYQERFNKRVTRLSYAIRTMNTDTAHILIPNKRELYYMLVRLINEGQACGEIRDDLSSSQIAEILLYSIRGVVFSWSLPGTRFDIRKKGDILVKILRPGLVKQ